MVVQTIQNNCKYVLNVYKCVPILSNIFYRSVLISFLANICIHKRPYIICLPFLNFQNLQLGGGVNKMRLLDFIQNSLVREVITK